jgi:hypothetical protein
MIRKIIRFPVRFVGNVKARRTHFGNRSINDALVAKLLPKSFGDFVSTVVLRDFFAENENPRITFHFLLEGVVEGITNSELQDSCHLSENIKLPVG